HICPLLANLINEKIFTGLWWWLQLLTAISVVNTIQWLYRLWSSDARQDFLASSLLPSVDLVLPSLEDVPVDESIRSGETNEESLNTDSCDDSGVRSASPLPTAESDTSREGLAERREKERCAFREKIVCELKNFEKFVGADGILVLRLIQSNAGEFFTSAVVGKIFHEFQPDSMK
ncbi:Protein INX-12, partial [Aphelenchoides avenae]